MPIPSTDLKNFLFDIFKNYRCQLNFASHFELTTENIQIFCQRQFLLTGQAANLQTVRSKRVEKSKGVEKKIVQNTKLLVTLNNVMNV